MESWKGTYDILILLCGALAFGLLFEKLKQSAIIGYLIAGILLGPSVLNFVHNKEVIEATAELGVALLLFTIGLEFSWSKLRALGTPVLWSGIFQIIVTGGTVTAICLLLGLDTRISITLGAIFAPSSTAIVLRILSERGELDGISGRTSLGILLLQDLAIVPLVLLVSELGKESSMAGMIFGLGRSTIIVGLFFSVFYLFNRFVISRFLDISAGTRNSELLFLLAVVIAVGSAWAAYNFGVSPSLGAFVAGMLLAESPFAVHIRADISALKILFLTLFFGSVGMLANITWMLQNWLLVILVAAGVIFGKAIIIWLITSWLIGSRRHALTTGISISQVGEFSFLLAGIALKSTLLSNDFYQLVVSVTLLSFFVTPLMVVRSHDISYKVEKLLTRKPQGDSDIDSYGGAGISDTCHAVLVGFGPAGRSVWQMLEAAKIPTALIEMNHKTVAEADKSGLKAILGDATREQVLRKANIEKATVLVITIPDPHASMQIIRQARAITPGISILARARYNIYANDLKESGADIIIDEEQNIGNLLGREVLKQMKVLCPEIIN